MYFFTEVPFLNQEHENVSTAGFSNKALPRAQLAKQILHSKENTFVTTKSKKDTFVLGGVDSVIEKSQNSTLETLNTNCVVKNDGQSVVSDSKIPTERTSQQEFKEGNEHTMPRETDVLVSMNDTCKIVLATPRLHITIPRKSKRNASNHSPSTLQTLTNEVKKNKVGQLKTDLHLCFYPHSSKAELKLSLRVGSFLFVCLFYYLGQGIVPSEKSSGLKARDTKC